MQYWRSLHHPTVAPLVVEGTKMGNQFIVEIDAQLIFNYRRKPFSLVRCEQTLRAHCLFVLQGKSINQAACDLAHEVASEGDALTLGGVSQTPSYLSGKGKAAVQEEFRKQIEVFVKNDIDFLLCEVSNGGIKDSYIIKGNKAG